MRPTWCRWKRSWTCCLYIFARFCGSIIVILFQICLICLTGCSFLVGTMRCLRWSSICLLKTPSCPPYAFLFSPLVVFVMITSSHRHGRGIAVSVSPYFRRWPYIRRWPYLRRSTYFRVFPQMNLIPHMFVYEYVPSFQIAKKNCRPIKKSNPIAYSVSVTRPTL